MSHPLSVFSLLACVLFSAFANAAVDVRTGSAASCFNVVSDLQRDWMEVKNHLIPGTGSLDGRPDDDQFVCVSPFLVREAMERRSSRSARCFKQSRQNISFCCDQKLSECAMLNPGLFPDAYQQPESNRAYEPPKSIWVRPPTDEDQWQSN